MTRYAWHPDVRFTSLQDEGVALHLGSRRYFTVNETGHALLDRLRQPATSDELVAVLCATYDVEPPHARKSVDAFVQRCLDAALLIRVE